VEKLAGIAANSDVTIESLMDAGIITTNDGPLKVLGNGDLGVALNVKAAAWSKSAQEKIEAAGGSISAPDHGNTDQ